MSSPSTPTHASQPLLGDFTTPQNLSPAAAAAAQEEAALTTPPQLAEQTSCVMPRTPPRPNPPGLAPVQLFASNADDSSSPPPSLPRRRVLRLVHQRRASVAAAAAPEASSPLAAVSVAAAAAPEASSPLAAGATTAATTAGSKRRRKDSVDEFQSNCTDLWALVQTQLNDMGSKENCEAVIRTLLDEARSTEPSSWN
jgi:hypothetical protein